MTSIGCVNQCKCIQVHHLIFIICILYTLFFNNCTAFCGTILKICRFAVCKTKTLQNAQTQIFFFFSFCGRLEKICEIVLVMHNTNENLLSIPETEQCLKKTKKQKKQKTMKKTNLRT